MTESIPRRTKRQKFLISLLNAFEPMTAPEIIAKDPRKASHAAILGSMSFLRKHGVVEIFEEKGKGVSHSSFRLTAFGRRVAIGVSNYYLTYR